MRSEVLKFFSYFLGVPNMKADGIFGIGFKPSEEFISLLDYLKNSGKIEERIFGLDLSGLKGKNGSRIIFGDWHRDITATRESFEWIDVPKNAQYWEVNPKYLYIGNKTFSTPKSSKKIKFKKFKSYLIHPRAISTCRKQC